MWASSENEDLMKELNCASSFLSAARVFLIINCVIYFFFDRKK